ncbi:YdcF family protein [Cyanobium sp. Aljojuca 7D2]|uniref:YdcF family protein n=1 Tax=Cyanobium sp. Aljojuca 7D2 TaxID=2823698 RepID=UPI0020CC754D|nr:YdcF family protein [Cyanobium sp. Aljojuca 7D2]MCP9890281.1 YdcF family protein [Cyanobium sp. Aljojuca 7D2]
MLTELHPGALPQPALPAEVAWQHCPPQPLAWFGLREALLQLLHTPALLLSLIGLLSALISWRLPWPLWQRSLLVLLVPLALSTLYSSASTALLTAWLQNLQPDPAVLAAPGPSGQPLPVVVIPGRGDTIAAATTAEAASLLAQHRAAAVYVSGDAPASAERLLALGVEPARIAGDSCARTTWENATVTQRWLQQHHPGAPVLLITDRWQLPRSAQAFRHQQLAVVPIAAQPTLSAHDQNRLALRETAATLLYAMQGRM